MSDVIIKGVNCTKIGQGLYDMMSDDLKAVVAFGMLPKTFMDQAERLTEDKLRELGTRFDASDMRKIMHQISVAIYGAASTAGRMVV